MKKRIFVFLLPVLLAAGLNAQFVELGAATMFGFEQLNKTSKLENIVYYAQMIEQQIQAAQNTWEQVQGMIRAEQRAIENMKTIENVHSYADFMSWYNRQLYLEHDAENRFNSIGIRIGGNNYSLSEIESIPGALSGRFADAAYWNDFSESQRRQMWIGLGLSPSNYVYQSAWKEREMEMAKKIMTKRETLLEESENANERYRDLFDQAAFAGYSERALLQALFNVNVGLNNSITGLRLDMAEAEERRLAESRLNNAPQSRAPVSDMYGSEIFAPIAPGKGGFIDLYP